MSYDKEEVVCGAAAQASRNTPLATLQTKAAVENAARRDAEACYAWKGGLLLVRWSISAVVGWPYSLPSLLRLPGRFPILIVLPTQTTHTDTTSTTRFQTYHVLRC